MACRPISKTKRFRLVSIDKKAPSRLELMKRPSKLA
jgi:hypothetical protein